MIVVVVVLIVNSVIVMDDDDASSFVLLQDQLEMSWKPSGSHVGCGALLGLHSSTMLRQLLSAAVISYHCCSLSS